MKYYEFDQNNSGGSFEINDKVTHRLFIEAENEETAINKAEDLGVYFDGCENGHDCPCCGDRWYEPNEVDLENISKSWKIQFNTIEDYAQHMADNYGWTKPDAFIYKINGEKVSIYSKKIK